MLKWPIDILAVELAVGYGAVRLLTAYFGGFATVPPNARLAAAVTLGAASLVTVARYLPDDTHFFHFESNLPLYVWHVATFGLAVGAPFVAISGDTPVFWGMAIVSEVAKGIYSLEGTRRKKPSTKPDQAHRPFPRDPGLW